MGSRVASTFRDSTSLVVGGLAVYRLTRLVVDDKIAEPIRDRIVEAAPEGWLANLVTCPWCVSVWAGFAWAGLTAAAPAVAAPVGAALAWSAVAGLLSSLE
jgi:hypothetical protein